ncbi:reverse transcriptase domain-containing protein [Tanacetum coccineum]|uniref:Reverse transcriptase domain-containing protein n=1 Tax=Tanacetum coccineum TaxID=301880 RepID=A0ABQ5IR47_9ASTR
MADDRPMAEQLQAPTGGYPDVPNTTIKLLLFPFSLDGVAKTWLDKEPPNSILTWDDLVSKFINFFFPPSKTTNLRNEITNFRQIAQESFSEAWERFKELLRNNSAAGGNFLIPKSAQRRATTLREQSQSFEFQQMAAALEDKMTLTFRNELNEMKNMMKSLVPTPVPIKAVEESYPRKLTQGFSQQAQAYQVRMHQLGYLFEVQVSNLCPLLMEENFGLPDLTSTRMVLELADRTISKPLGIAENVFVKVGKFYFPVDFVILDFAADPRVPLILGRPFLSTAHALIDVYEGEIILRHDDQSLILKCGDTPTVSYDNSESVNRMDLIDATCAEYAPKVLDFTKSGDSTSIILDPPPFTPFEGDMRSLDLESLLEVLNDDPFSQFSPKKQINNVESVKTSIEEPPDLELKDLPAHLEYAFLEKDNKLPVIISKDLKDDEKVKLIEVLKAHKSALAWKISDIKGLCTGLNFYYTTTEKEMLAVVYALEKFRPYLVLSRTIVYTDHSAIKYLMAKQDAKSRKNPTKNELEKQHITESFPLESLGRFESVKEINVNENVVNENEKVVENVVLNNMNVLSDNTTPWFADLANYHAGNFVKKGMSSQIKREQIFKMQNTTLGVPYLFKILCGPVIRRVFFGREAMRILMVVIVDPRDGIPSANYTARLSL